MEYTDHDVPASCQECGEIVYGIEAMREHLTASHKDYTPEEVEKYAKSWIEGAHDNMEDEEKAYYEEKALRISRTLP